MLRTAVALVALFTLAAPTTAAAVVNVTRDASGAVLVMGSDAVDDVTITRDADGLQVSVGATGAASSDSSCAAGAELSAAVTCTVASGAPVTVLLGGGNDRLDARAATSVALTVNGGGGADTFRVGGSGAIRVTDSTATDTVDLAHADSGVRVRYERAAARLVARCGGCAFGWAVTLPINPGRVLLGAGTDDVDLGTWRGFGRTTWSLGAEDDRFWASPTRRSVVDAGPDNDILVSRTAPDVLRGGADLDKIADFGGTGDVLEGGAGIDALSSLDGRRDRIDGGGDRDVCHSKRRPVNTCDTGPVRNVELGMYMPIASQASILRALGIR